jgi:hypothetical protein
MKVTHQSKNYSPEAVLARYVKYLPWSGEFEFCEVGRDRRFDLRQGTVEYAELPDGLPEKAILHAERSCSYITWPITRQSDLSEQTADAVGGSFPNLAAAIRKHGV